MKPKNSLKLGILLTIFSIINSAPAKALITTGLGNLESIGVPKGTTATFLGEPVAVGISDRSIADLPVGGKGKPDGLLVLTTGNATYTDKPLSIFDDPDRDDDPYDLRGVDLGDFGPDVSLVKLSFPNLYKNQPSILEFDFSFLSNEYPDFVGSQFNDFFTATINGGNNIAVDLQGKLINVNNGFLRAAPTSIGTFGTFYKGQTDPLRVIAPVKTNAETIDLTFTVSDAVDGIFDSGVLINNIKHRASQTVYLNFSGGTMKFWGKDVKNTEFLVTPDLVKPGQTIEQATNDFEKKVVNLVKSAFEDFNIEIVTQKPTDGRQYSEVAIGGGDNNFLNKVRSNGDVISALGVANSVDTENKNRSDTARVFTDHYYQGYLFQSGNSDYISKASELRKAIESLIKSSVPCKPNESCSIKNSKYYLHSSAPDRVNPFWIAHTVVHELGHILGLYHVEDASVMGASNTNLVFSEDALINARSTNQIVQNSYQTLAQTLGQTEPFAFRIEESILDNFIKILELKIEDLFDVMYNVQIGMAYSEVDQGIFTIDLAKLDIDTLLDLELPLPLLDGGLFISASSTPDGEADIFSLAPGITNINQIQSIEDYTINIFDDNDNGDPVLTPIDLFLIDEDGNASLYGSITVEEKINEEPVSVPETSTILSLLALGGIVLSTSKKKRRLKNLPKSQ